MDHPAAVPAFRPVTSRNLCRFARYAPSKSSRWRKATSDDPTAHSQSPAPGPGPRADRCTRGTQMTISHGGLKLAVCAVTAALALAACSTRAASGESVTSTSGGVRLGAGGQRHAARRHDHLGRGARHRADLDLPGGAGRRPHGVPPSTASSTSCGGRCTGTPTASQPTETPSMSLANQPTYSNGDKTVTVTMKTNYKWSDGQPVTSKDALFFLDEVRAAVKESGANWGQYTPARRDTRPGGQRQHAERHHARAQPEQAGQPAVVHRGRCSS